MNSTEQHLEIFEIERLAMMVVPRFGKDVSSVGENERIHAQTCQRCANQIAQFTVKLEAVPLEDYPPAG